MEVIPKLKLRKGYYYAKIKGKNTYLGKDKENAKKKLQQLVGIALIADSNSNQPRCYMKTVEEIMLLYYEENAKFYVNQAPLRCTTREIACMFPDTLAIEFTASELEEYQLALADRRLSRSTIKDRVSMIKNIYRWAAKRKLLPVSAWQELLPVENLKRGRTNAKESKKIAPVDRKTLGRTLKYADPMIRDMALVQLYGGMRPSEMTSMRPCNIARLKCGVWLYIPEHHKNENKGKERNIYLGPKAQMLLLKYIEKLGWESSKYIFSPREAQRERVARLRAARKSKVQPSQQGRRACYKDKPLRYFADHYDKDSYSKAIKRAIQRAGVEHWTPYQLRHSAGTLARKIAGLDGAQAFLGHCDANTTEIYAELDSAKAIKIAMQIG